MGTTSQQTTQEKQGGKKEGESNTLSKVNLGNKENEGLCTPSQNRRNYRNDCKIIEGKKD
jgi:hypothetical protein